VPTSLPSLVRAASRRPGRGSSSCEPSEIDKLNGNPPDRPAQRVSGVVLMCAPTAHVFSFGCAVRYVLHHLCARVYVTPPTPPRPCGDKGRFARSRAGFEKVAKWVTRAIVPPRRALVRLPRRRTQRIVGVNGRRVRACASSSRIPERDERIPELSSASYAKDDPPLSPPPRGRDRRVVVEAWRGVGARYWCGFRALQPFNALALLPRPCPHFTCAIIVEYTFVRSHSHPPLRRSGSKTSPVRSGRAGRASS